MKKSISEFPLEVQDNIIMGSALEQLMATLIYTDLDRDEINLITERCSSLLTSLKNSMPDDLK